MNYRDKCRTCLGHSKEMRHINTAIRIAGAAVRLSDILQNFYDFKISPEDESYPEHLCITCVHQLTITYSFKILIDSSAKTLAEKHDSDDNGADTCDYEPEDIKPENNYKVRRLRRCQMNKPQANLPTESEKSPVFCVECKARLQTVKLLNEHCTNNHPVKNDVGRDCDYCNEKFEDFRSLVRHRKLHLKPYLCENCWEGFYEEIDLNSHCCQPNRDKEKHPSERMLRQCDQCGKSYPPGYIRIHMLTHGNDRPYKCKFCPKRFKVPGGLNSHVLWNHKRTRNHKCEVCNATFISSSSRSSHIRKNHLKEKKYGCESCGKRFFSKSELQRHSLTHTGVKNFHCHLCDKSYQTRYGLNVHLKSHSQNINMNILNL